MAKKRSNYRDQFVLLFSTVRREAVRAALYAFNTEFLTPDEQHAWKWLRSYVRDYSEFPKPSTVFRELGITTLKTREPWGYYADRLRKMHIYERGAINYKEFVEAFRSADVDAAAEQARAYLSLHQRLTQKETGVIDFGGSLDEVIADYGRAYLNPGLRGIQTGWGHVDNATGGWQDGDLITFAGRPGVGKTYTLLHSSYTAWMAGHKILFVSNEMAALSLARRMVGIHTRINPDLLRKGQLSSHVRNRFLDGVQYLKSNSGNLRMLIGGMKKSVTAVRAAAEEFQPDAIYVDASYLLTPEKRRSGSEGRRETFSDVVEELRAVCLDLNRPIIQSVQFNRTAVRAEPRTRGGQNTPDESASNPLSHLGLHKMAETDVVGQASAIAIGIEKWPPPFHNTRRYMGFLKGREGETGHWSINYQFNPVDFTMIREEQEQQEAEALSIDYML